MKEQKKKRRSRGGKEEKKKERKKGKEKAEKHLCSSLYSLSVLEMPLFRSKFISKRFSLSHSLLLSFFI
ncbi:hypothetical protein [Clostridium sp. ZBS13]|uniref:hypothetical protein n=1 Tax=Clostridium sp. ZBS13 TaxID=2949971 RepID=UPI00207AAACC|nr:hypothetical protein [Clostridium sp. ZBS13]